MALEALGTASSVIAVLQLTASLITTLYEWQGSMRGASNDAKRLATELSSMLPVLQAVESLGGEKERLNTLAVLCEPDGLVAKYKDALESLKTRLQLPEGRGKKALRTLTWPLTEKDVQRVLDYIERLKSTTQMAMHADETSILLVIDKGMRDLSDIALPSLGRLETGQEALEAQMKGVKIAIDSVHSHVIAECLSDEEEKTRQDLLSWIDARQAPDLDKEGRKRHGTTGDWFLTGDTFKTWLETGGSLIWLNGKVGCGKTVLCTSIIQELLQLYVTQPSSAFTFFYFDFRNDYDLKDALCSLVDQLVRHLNSIPANIRDWFSLRSSSRKAAISELTDLLRMFLDHFEHVYIVMDALDECAKRQRLIEWIGTFFASLPANAHVLMTSRCETDIEQCFRRLRSLNVGIDNKIVDKDIQAFVRNQLGNDPVFARRNWSSDVKAEIETTLMRGAHGMFRWVVCQLDSLQKCKKVAQVKATLSSLPKDLDETYLRIIQAMDAEDRKDALNLLTWIIFAFEQSTTDRLAEVAAIEFNNSGTPHFNPDARLSNPHDIVEILGSLVVVPSNSHSVELAHFSVQEYLLSDRNKSDIQLSHSSCHGHIAISCLTYLIENNSRYLQSLAKYAAEYWPSHVQACGHNVSNDLLHQSLTILDNTQPYFHKWLSIYDVDKEDFHMHLFQIMRHHTRQTFHSSMVSDLLDYSITASPLYYAVRLGLVDIVPKQLAINPDDVNMCAGYYGTPLHAAVHQHCIDIIQLLLGAEADINKSIEWMPQHISSTHNHTINFHNPPGPGGTVLQMASHDGNTSVIQMLLDAGANIDAPAGPYGTALQAASAKGHADIVQILLNAGASANEPAVCGGTVLEEVSHNGHRSDIVQNQTLLKAGASVNTSTGPYGTALQAASSEGHSQIVQILVDAGANVNAPAGPRGTALQAASYYGYANICQILLQAGAEVNAPAGPNGTALQAATAVYQDRADIISILLNAGADVNAPARPNETALQASKMETIRRKFCGNTATDPIVVRQALMTRKIL